MFSHTLTVFCYHKGFWYPYVISGCSLYVTTAETLTSKGFVNAGAVDINIQTSREKEIQTSQGIVRYISPKEFAGLDSPEGYMTLSPEQDFIFDGAYEDLTPVDDEDYDSGFYNELNKRRDGVYSITAAGWFGVIPHIEVGAK